MKLPRDLSGSELAAALRKFGYEMTRQTGSHVRLTSLRMGAPHHVTIPAHRTLKVGTLGAVLDEVARYLKLSRGDLTRDLFG